MSGPTSRVASWTASVDALPPEVAARHGAVEVDGILGAPYAVAAALLRGAVAAVRGPSDLAFPRELGGAA